MKEVPGRLASEHTSDRTFSLQSCRTQRKLFQRASEGIYFRPGSIQFKVLRLEKEEGGGGCNKTKMSTFLLQKKKQITKWNQMR